MRVLVTGATGFVGKALLPALSNHEVTVLARTQPSEIDSTHYFKAQIDNKSDYSQALQGVDVVVHLAARVHVMAETAKDPYAEFCATNRDGTLNLAEQAARAGVKRFIFLSTIKVNGEQTLRDAFQINDEPKPQEPYARSKFEAEKGLKEIAKKSNMEAVIIRPPLIYGPGVKANFKTMIKWVNSGVPLPLGWVKNKRSFLALENLIDFIKVCISHPLAANKTFIVSDEKALSTSELLRAIAKALGKPSRLIPVPPAMLYWGLKGFGLRSVFDRLCGSLQVKSNAKDELGWVPPVSMDEQLRKMFEQRDLVDVETDDSKII